MKNFIVILTAVSMTVLSVGFVMPFNKIEEGIYSGQFKVIYPSGKIFTGKATIEIGPSTYVCTGNKKRIPAGGSGTYMIHEAENKISFADENIWTADFDWNLILNGVYDFSVDGKNLTLSAKREGGGYYEYRLNRK